MWKNKHVVVAVLVAPVLAVLAWFAVDYFVAERPHAAKEGATYTLLAKSNCRYASGRCDLENADFKLSIRPEMRAATAVALIVTSSHRLDSALIAVVDADAAGAPAGMTRTDDAGREWQALISPPHAADAAVRVAVTAQGATWFAEVPAVFFATED